MPWAYTLQKRVKSESASVLTELAFIVPVLVVFMIGIVTLGSQLSQLPSLIHTSYLVAEYSGKNGTDADLQSWAQNLFDRSQLNAELSTAASLVVAPQVDEMTDTVTIDTSAAVKNIVNLPKALSIKTSLTGPVYREDASGLGTGDSFAGCFNDCGCSAGWDPSLCSFDGAGTEAGCQSVCSGFGIPPYIAPPPQAYYPPSYYGDPDDNGNQVAEASLSNGGPNGFPPPL